MRIVCCVPMKLNNERLPNKNTMRMANGQPLCSFVLNTLRKVSNIDNIFVYCSNDQIKKHIPHDIHFLRRSASLDTNKTSMIEVLKSFSHDVSADIYVLVHVTAPFLKESSIESAICKVKDGGYDSAFSVEKFSDFIWVDGVPNYDTKNIPRTQDLTPYYKETSGFYIFNKDIITKLGQRIGNKPYLQNVSRIEAVDIDNQEDAELANMILKHQLIEGVLS